MTIPTTYEIDGLITEEDIKNRQTVMSQCKVCKKWTKQVDYSLHQKYVPCEHCGATNYDSSSNKSIRTYKPLTDNKRKVK